MPTLSTLPAVRAAGLSLMLTLGFSVAQAVPATMSAAQIVDKHVAARGGLAAWRSVQSFSMNGKMDVGTGDSTARSMNFVRGEMPSAHRRPMPASTMPTAPAPAAKQVQVPFTMEVKRPHKSRIEIIFAGKTAVQVYDGTSGWKLRPYLNRDDYEPFSPEELKIEAASPGIDEPLVDFAARGTRVDLDGIEPVDGRDAYKLKLTHKDGTIQHIWIDAKTFLDVKLEGTPRRMDGRLRTVWITQRDFRSVQGIMIPFERETAVDGYRETHKMVIEKASVNPPLADTRFTKPGGA
jgi:outer membrane lipoprotein-sorting protein